MKPLPILTRISTVLLLAGAIIAGTAPPAFCGDYGISASVFGSGGAMAGGGYAVTGTAGQAVSGSTSSEALAIGGGFWAYGKRFTSMPVLVGAKGHPETFALIGCHPNPFNPATAVSFAVPQACRAKLAVYSVSGQRVAVLLDGPVKAGIHTAVWRPRGFASGVYLYVLDTGGKRFRGKMTLAK